MINIKVKLHNKGATTFNQETTVMKNILLLSNNIMSKNNLLKNVHLLNPSQLHPEILMQKNKFKNTSRKTTYITKHKEFFEKFNWYLHMIWVVD